MDGLRLKVRTYAWRLRGECPHGTDGPRLKGKDLCLKAQRKWFRMIWMGWDQPNLVGRYFVPYRSAKIGWTVLYIKLWLPSGQWLGHISRYLHDFFEVPSQCLNIIIETNWFLSTTWSITTRISVSWCRWLGVDISTDRVCIPTYQSTYTMFLRPPADVLIVLLKWFQKLGV